MEFTTLMVDVDGTLIDALDHPYDEVVAAVQLVAAQFDEVVIWSGGGLDYASTWARRLFPRSGFEAAAKVPFSGLASSVLVVDDMAGDLRAGTGAFLTCTLMTPLEFVVWASRT